MRTHRGKVSENRRRLEVRTLWLSKRTLFLSYSNFNGETLPLQIHVMQFKLYNDGIKRSSQRTPPFWKSSFWTPNKTSLRVSWHRFDCETNDQQPKIWLDFLYMVSAMILERPYIFHYFYSGLLAVTLSFDSLSNYILWYRINIVYGNCWVRYDMNVYLTSPSCQSYWSIQDEDKS